ncbi:MAG: hypothetical protein ABFD49_07055 [Armatimonadota bacterium]|nr:hypothetical protein [bacterium]
MALMSDSEKAAAAADVRELIESSGQDATLLRAALGERLYGSDDEAFVEVRTFKLEFVPTPQEDIADNVDATASVLPDLDVRCEDRIKVGGDSFRVQTIVDESLFGVVTHKTLKLVRLYAS